MNIETINDPTRGTDVNDIAVIKGAANVYWNDQDRIVIEAADKNSAILVNVKANNDTISGNVGTIKMSIGTVKKASTQNSDVLITTSNDNIITLKNAKDKAINVVKGNGKALPTFYNEYAGDPDYLMESVIDKFNKAENDMADKLADDIESTDKSGELANIKDAFKIISTKKGVTLKDIPAKIYKNMAERIFEALSNSKTTELTSDYQTWLENLDNITKYLGVKTESVSVGKTNYDVTRKSMVERHNGLNRRCNRQQQRRHLCNICKRHY